MIAGAGNAVGMGFLFLLGAGSTAKVAATRLAQRETVPSYGAFAASAHATGGLSMPREA
jgi:hypothetical protein